MATVTKGTLILRPDASKGTGITPTPSGVAIEECYKLVNEEIADYESTYITLPAGSSIFFRFPLPSNIKITAFDSSTTIYVNGVARDCDEYNANAGDVDIGKESSTEHLCCWSDETSLDDSLTFITRMDDEPAVTTELSPISSSVVSMTDAIVTALHNNDLAYGLTMPSSLDDKVDARLSQIYLEISNVTYEEIVDSALTVFRKQSGVWTPITGTLYQKQDGTWVECDASVLTDEMQYGLEEV